MTDYVTQDEEVSGLAEMLAGLIRANIERNPSLTRYLQNCAGTINVIAQDADVTVGLEIAAGKMHVFSKPFRKAGLEIVTDAGTLLDLSNTPLLFGHPDLRTAAGREVVRKMMRRTLRVKGLFAHPFLLARLQRLLSAG